MSIRTNIPKPGAAVSQLTDAAPDIFASHMQRIFDWSYRISRNRQDAMDVVQDVFLKWHRQCAVAVPDAPTAWLRRVATNRALEFGRRRERDASAHLHLATNAVPPSLNAMNAADRSMLRHDILAALSSLSDSQRDVLLAKLLDDSTFSQIAIDMKIAVSTAKTHYLRAILAMREALSKRWEDEI
jgi:RNA polymerase sigma-70 factor (ECF subfamily)